MNESENSQQASISKEKANWMWGDKGVGYFGRGRGTKEGHTDEWALAWQCY